MDQITNASFTMADEMINTINEDRRQMLMYYREVLDYNSEAVKPTIDCAILIWVQIFNKVKQLDMTFYNHLKELKEKCIKISRMEIDRLSEKEQHKVLDTVTEFIEQLQEAFGLIGIDIKVKAK